MGKVKEQQMKFGEVDIATIEFDIRSRDEIPKLLMGVRHIYCTPEIREEVFRTKLWQILLFCYLRASFI